MSHDSAVTAMLKNTAMQGIMISQYTWGYK